MPIRIIINGAQGKMGRLACETIENHPDFELVGALGRHDDLSSEIPARDTQVVIDLTRADVVYENSLTIIESGAHPVIGTSGLLNEQIKFLQTRCQAKKLGGIIVPNFSIGAVLMMQFASQAARFISEVEIIEAHHPQKQDAPSGTAIKTAEMIAKARPSPANFLPNTKELLPGVRGARQEGIPIHSIRLPGLLARQEVIFGSIGETLTITHQSIDRASFMPGLILACQRVGELNALYYGLENLLE